MPRALDCALLLVELTFDQRSVVMRAAVLDRVYGAGAVEHADLELLPLNKAHPARRELIDRTNLDQGACTIECPRHGSLFDLKTGQPKSLPAYVPVDTFPVIIEEETIKLEVE